MFPDANRGEGRGPDHPWPMSQTLISFPPHRGPPPVTINFPSATLSLAERAVCAADRMPCAVPDRCCPVGGYCTTDAIGQPGCCPINAICKGVTNTGQGVFVPVETGDSTPYIPTGASSNLRPPTVFGFLNSLFQVVSSELSTLGDAQRTEQHGNSRDSSPKHSTSWSEAHEDHTSTSEISEKIGVAFPAHGYNTSLYASSAPRHMAPLAWALRAVCLPVKAASWPLVSIREQRKFETGGYSGDCEKPSNNKNSRESLGIGSALFNMWTGMKAMLS